ncbi:MAG: TerC family protein [Candidatus Latescibacterota bacterium]|nr:MAG: TerC family protein [Candidatus Latescibacterota bacterium]
MELQSVGTPGLWAGFIGFVLAMLALDLGVFHRKAHAIGFREAAIWTGVWIGLAALFNVWVYVAFGGERGLEFTTGYLIEKALSVDNIFVFVMVFAYFAVPAALQHRVLLWGILGALVLRAAFILIGGAFLSAFHWAIYVFGAVLIFTGIRMLRQGHESLDPGRNPLVRLVRRLVPVTETYHGSSFFVREGPRLVATPLFLTLLVVEFTDLVFAIDSIPAIFAVTKDPFIVFTSNIFAILGLRSLYFLLAGLAERFVYLKAGLSIILIFVGVKMMIVDVYKIPVALSLGVIGAILAAAVAASLLKTGGGAGHRPPA